MLRQRTLREKIQCTGVGLHSGKQIRLEMLPAPEDTGIVFVRCDLPNHPEIRACASHVTDTTLATTLSAAGASVATVEHLLAALSGLGIDNVRIMVDGAELPIADGSAAPFVALLQAAGIERQRRNKRFLVIKKEVRVSDGDKVARIVPASRLRISCALDFDHPLISATPLHFDYSEKAFVRELAPARTFGFLEDVEALRARGLARGGSLDNAIVIDAYKVLNQEGLRFSDEFVRHKLLDAMGDMALFGMPLLGRLSLHRSGHALNCALVRAVLSDAKAFCVVQPALQPHGRDAQQEGNTFELLDDVQG
ncbi:MAG: UDP-3-O-acyl-N-acetylglucosamine deacetylase, partial [Deltaproteobacteria bacterium]